MRWVWKGEVRDGVDEGETLFLQLCSVDAPAPPCHAARLRTMSRTSLNGRREDHVERCVVVRSDVAVARRAI